MSFTIPYAPTQLYQQPNKISDLLMRMGEVQAEGRLHLADLGVFTLRDRKARVMAISGAKVGAYKTIHFQPAANFKRAVNLR